MSGRGGGQNHHVVVLAEAVQSAVHTDSGGLAVHVAEVAVVDLTGVGEVHDVGIVPGDAVAGSVLSGGGEGSRLLVHHLQVALGGVYVELSGGTVVLGSAREHSEVRAIEVGDGEESRRVAGVASGDTGVGAQVGDGVPGQGIVDIGVAGVIGGGDGGVLGGVHQLDQVGVVDVSEVPVVHINIVGGVTVAVTQTLLEELDGGSRGQLEQVVGGVSGQGHQHVLAEIGNHVHVLADEAVGVDLPAQSGGGLVGEESGASAVQELVDGDLLQLSGVLGEGQGVLGVHVHSSVIDRLNGGVLAVGDTAIGGLTLVAEHAVSGDDIVGQLLQGGGHGGAVSVPVQSSSLPVLAVGVEEGQRVVSGKIDTGSLGVELVGEVGESDVLGVIVVQRVSTPLAQTLRAVRSSVSRITDATHGRILIPELVNIAEIAGGDLLDGLAGAVA